MILSKGVAIEGKLEKSEQPVLVASLSKVGREGIRSEGMRSRRYMGACEDPQHCLNSVLECLLISSTSLASTPDRRMTGSTKNLSPTTSRLSKSGAQIPGWLLSENPKIRGRTPTRPAFRATVHGGNQDLIIWTSVTNGKLVLTASVEWLWVGAYRTYHNHKPANCDLGCLASIIITYVHISSYTDVSTPTATKPASIRRYPSSQEPYPSVHLRTCLLLIGTPFAIFPYP